MVDRYARIMDTIEMAIRDHGFIPTNDMKLTVVRRMLIEAEKREPTPERSNYIVDLNMLILLLQLEEVLG
jgi:hypothetical protein